MVSPLGRGSFRFVTYSSGRGCVAVGGLSAISANSQGIKIQIIETRDQPRTHRDTYLGSGMILVVKRKAPIREQALVAMEAMYVHQPR